MSTIPPRSRTPGGAAYAQAGTGAALVLVHGVGMRLEAWGPQIAALSTTNRVIALDMPGHGDSDPLPAGSALPDFVRWLGGVLDDLGLARAALAGHSMGALIAGAAAITFPERIARVALLNPVFRRSPEARAAVVARAAGIGRGEIDVDGPLDRWFGEADKGSEAAHAVRGWLRAVDPGGYATAYGAFAAGDATYADRWGEYPGPALFLTGRDDPNSTPAMAAAMADAAPQGRAAVIEGRHMVGLTAPDAVNRALADWLSSEERPA